MVFYGGFAIITKEKSRRMKHTPLFSQHQRLGGRIVDFGGWALPIQYAGIIAEHEAVRSAAGLFDVSHMGEIEVRGKGAVDYLQRLVTGDVAKLADGRILYALMCNHGGGVVDDILLYRFNEAHFLLVVNAANTEKDFHWLCAHAAGDVLIENESDRFAQIAIQGPNAQAILQGVSDVPLSDIGFFRFMQGVNVDSKRALVSRTGYTGEDGFEIYLDAGDAQHVWAALLDAGAPLGLVPAGLGARDTLRFEAALPLYGHELSEEISPFEAGLAPFVKLDKGDFIGREALVAQRENGAARERIGFVMKDRGVPRSGYPLMLGDETIGVVSSGGFAPTLKQNAGMALVRRGAVDEGGELSVVVRDRALRAVRVPLPLYRKRYKK
jgi:aminomethyltransferase